MFKEYFIRTCKFIQYRTKVTMVIFINDNIYLNLLLFWLNLCFCCYCLDQTCGELVCQYS